LNQIAEYVTQAEALNDEIAHILKDLQAIGTSPLGLEPTSSRVGTGDWNAKHDAR
jgi:hypothetical protein